MAMHTWFECKIRYEKTMENGMNKKVTEPYLVDALSFTILLRRRCCRPLVQMQTGFHHIG